MWPVGGGFFYLQGREQKFVRKKIFFVRTPINFLAEENIFPCGRKYFFVRREFWTSQNADE
ncbi:hypothetical protein HQ45_01120 [Porphyromonas crevioricanis]|nr:hypothetical protein HQ45_01120 [Porphyromonas crevioricanis]